MDLDELSARVDALAYPARQRVLADTARALAGSPELSALLAELGARPGVTRTWAIAMASIAGERNYLRQCLTSPDLAMSGSAVRYCVRHELYFDAIANALPTAPTAWRQTLYRGLRANGRTAWADNLLSSVRTRFGDHEAAAILPACAEDTITALLPELGLAVTNRTTLARRHPAVVLAHLRRLLDAASESGRGETWRRYASTIGALVEHDAAQVLGLLQTRGPISGLPPGADGWLAALARTDPERLIAVLTEPGLRPAFALSERLCAALSRTSGESLAALARSLRHHPGRLGVLLRRLPPSQRPAVFAGARWMARMSCRPGWRYRCWTICHGGPGTSRRARRSPPEPPRTTRPSGWRSPRDSPGRRRNRCCAPRPASPTRTAGPEAIGC